MKKKVRELLIEAYNSNDVCDKWKKKVKEAAPKLFTEKKELVVGEWYMTEKKSLFCYTGGYDENMRPLGYGVAINGEWLDVEEIGWSCEIGGGYNPNIRIATNKEVKTALIKEAKKRGLWGDIEIENHADDVDDSNWTITTFAKGFSISGRLYSERGVIFYNGKWAVPKPSVKELTVQEISEKLGYEVKIIK